MDQYGNNNYNNQNPYGQQNSYNQQYNTNQYQNNIPQQKESFKLKQIEIISMVLIAFAAMLMGFKLLMGDLSFGDIAPFISTIALYVAMRFMGYMSKNNRNK